MVALENAVPMVIPVLQLQVAAEQFHSRTPERREIPLVLVVRNIL